MDRFKRNRAIELACERYRKRQANKLLKEKTLETHTRPNKRHESWATKLKQLMKILVSSHK